MTSTTPKEFAVPKNKVPLASQVTSIIPTIDGEFDPLRVYIHNRRTRQDLQLFMENPPVSFDLITEELTFASDRLRLLPQEKKKVDSNLTDKEREEQEKQVKHDFLKANALAEIHNFITQQMSEINLNDIFLRFDGVVKFDIDRDTRRPRIVRQGFVITYSRINTLEFVTEKILNTLKKFDSNGVCLSIESKDTKYSFNDLGQCIPAVTTYKYPQLWPENVDSYHRDIGVQLSNTLAYLLTKQGRREQSALEKSSNKP
jgi:hypothetical protein